MKACFTYVHQLSGLYNLYYKESMSPAIAGLFYDSIKMKTMRKQQQLHNGLAWEVKASDRFYTGVPMHTHKHRPYIFD
jgi:hypothetical protein